LGAFLVLKYRAMAMKKAQLVDRKELTKDVVQFSFQCSEPFNFAAGQFVNIKIDDGNGPCFRAYSLNSAPNKKGTFELCVKVVEKGRGSNWLNSLDIKNEIIFLGPSGNFIHSTPMEKEILFIATGTGVAPFKAIIEDELKKGSKQKMHLIFGVRHLSGIFYNELFENLAKEHENFSFDMTLSRPENDSWKGHKGRVTDLLENMDIDTEKTEAYICGLNAMIESVEKLLQKKGLGQEQIHSEKYD